MLLAVMWTSLALQTFLRVVAKNGRCLLGVFSTCVFLCSCILDADSVDCEILLLMNLVWRDAHWHLIESRHFRYHCVLMVCSDCNCTSVLFRPRTGFIDVKMQRGCVLVVCQTRSRSGQEPLLLCGVFHVKTV